MKKPKAISPVKVESLPFEKALERIKATRKTLFLDVSVFLRFYTQNPNDKTPSGTEGRGLIQVSRRHLVAFFDESIPGHWKPKVKIDIIESDTGIIVGRAAK